MRTTTTTAMEIGCHPANIKLAGTGARNASRFEPLVCFSSLHVRIDNDDNDGYEKLAATPPISTLLREQARNATRFEPLVCFLLFFFFLLIIIILRSATTRQHAATTNTNTRNDESKGVCLFIFHHASKMRLPPLP